MHPARPRPPRDPAALEREQFATMLALMLLIMFGSAGLLFLIFVSLGLFLWVLVTGACIAAYAGLHYLAWGRSVRQPGAEPAADDPESPAMSATWPAELLDRTNRTKQGE